MPEKHDLPPVLERLGEDLHLAMKTADAARPIHPRRGTLNRLTRAIARTPRARRWATVAVAAIAVGVGVLVLGSSGGAPTSAFAGWAATPTAPARAETTSAQQRCTSQLAGTERAQSGIPAAGWKPVLIDTRGPFTAVILQSAGASATCFNGPSFTSIMASSAQGTGASEHVLGMGSASGAAPSAVSVMGLGPSSSGPISTASLSHLATSGGKPYTFMQGQVHAGVSGVVLVLSNGSNVQASVADGSFLAWWPGSADVASARVASAAGVITQRLTFTALPAPEAAQGPISSATGARSSGAASAAGAPASGPQVRALLAKCASKLPTRAAPREAAAMTRFLACMKANGVTLPTPSPAK